MILMTPFQYVAFKKIILAFEQVIISKAGTQELRDELQEKSKVLKTSVVIHLGFCGMLFCFTAIIVAVPFSRM